SRRASRSRSLALLGLADPLLALAVPPRAPTPRRRDEEDDDRVDERADETAARRDRDDDHEHGEPAVEERAVAVRMLRQRAFALGRPPAKTFHRSTPTSASTAATREPSRIAAATASMSSASGRSSTSLGESVRTNARAASP